MEKKSLINIIDISRKISNARDISYFEYSIKNGNFDLSNKHKTYQFKRYNTRFLHMLQHIIKDFHYKNYMVYYSKDNYSIDDNIKKKNCRIYFFKDYYQMYQYIANMDLKEINKLIRFAEINNQFINILFKEYWKER